MPTARPYSVLATLVLIAGSLAHGAPPLAGGPPRLGRASIELRLDPAGRTLAGRAELGLLGGAGPEIWLRLGPDFELTAASWTGTGGSVDASFEKGGVSPGGEASLWRVRAPAEVATATLVVHWRSRPGAAPLGISSAGIVLPDEDRWYPGLVPAGAGRGPAPPDNATGGGAGVDSGPHTVPGAADEPGPAAGTLAARGDGFELELRVEHPAGLRLLLAGASEAQRAPTASGAVSHFGPVSDSRGISLFGVAGKAVRRDIGRVPLALAGDPSVLPPRAHQLLAAIADQLEALVRDVGPFPWPRLDLLVTSATPPREAPGVLLLPPAWFERLEEGARSEPARPALLRQWIGQSLFATDPEGREVLEGIATFFSHVGETGEWAGYWASGWRDRLLDRWSGGAGPPPLADRVAMALEMLSARFGRERIHTVMRVLVARRAHRRCGWADLAAALAENVGREAVALAGRWRNQDPPELNVEILEFTRAGGRYRAEIALSSDRPTLLFVPLRVSGDEGPEIRREVRLDGTLAELTITAEYPLRWLEVDPERTIARRLPEAERVPRLGRLAGAPELVVVGSGRGVAFERQARSLARARFPAAKVQLDRELREEALRDAGRVLLLARPAPGAWRRFVSQLGDSSARWRVEGPGVGVESHITDDPAGFAAVALKRMPGDGGIVVLVDAMSPESLGPALDAVSREPAAEWLLGRDGETTLSGDSLRGTLMPLNLNESVTFGGR